LNEIRKTILTVAEIFGKANLRQLQGPVPWGTPISECSEGVYMVARVEDPNGTCPVCELPFEDPLPSDLVLNPEYERRRWLPNEPILYIAQTKRSLCVRIAEFYCHQVGDKRPHAGGQVIKLLACDRWVYYSTETHPREPEKKMLFAFEQEAGKPPFANAERGKPKRIRCLT
jgi:hypothetical protein